MAKKNQYPSKVFTSTQASCGRCKTMQPFSAFSADANAPKGLAYWCRSCSSANARKHHAQRKKSDPTYPRKKREAWVKATHGITLQQYEEKLLAQGSACGICKTPLISSGPLTHLDHCHITNKLRDFLCTNCNRGLGHFKDNEQHLGEAMKYLKRHKL